MNTLPATTVGPKEDSRGLSDVQGLLLGSVTPKVMQLAEIAVLVGRGPIPVVEKVVQPAFTQSPPLRPDQ
jgi:hypothetical protein